MSDKHNKAPSAPESASVLRHREIRNLIEAATPIVAKVLDAQLAYEDRRWSAIEKLAESSPDVALSVVKSEAAVQEKAIEAFRTMWSDLIALKHEQSARQRAETSAKRAEKAAYRAEAAASATAPGFTPKYAGKNGETDRDDLDSED